MPSPNGLLARKGILELSVPAPLEEPLEEGDKGTCSMKEAVYTGSPSLVVDAPLRASAEEDLLCSQDLIVTKDPCRTKLETVKDLQPLSMVADAASRAPMKDAPLPHRAGRSGKRKYHSYKAENEPSRSAKKEKDKESEPLLTVADAASRASTRAAQLLHRADKIGKRKHHCYNAEYEPSRPAKKEKNMVMEPLSTVADADSRAPTKAAPLPHRAAKRGKRKHHSYQAEYEPSRSAKKEKG